MSGHGFPEPDATATSRRVFQPSAALQPPAAERLDASTGAVAAAVFGDATGRSAPAPAPERFTLGRAAFARPPLTQPLPLAEATGATAPDHAALTVLAGASEGLARMADQVLAWQSAVAELAELAAAGAPGCEAEPVQVLRFTDRARLRRWLDERAPLNTREAVAMHPVLPSNDVLRESLKVDRDLVRRGVEFRMLVSRTAARRSGAGAYLGALERVGAQVRVAEALPLRLLLIDGSVVVTPGVDGEPPCDLVIRSRVVGRCLLAAFEHMWVTAEKYASFAGAGDDRQERLTAVHVRLLRALATGAKDEAIARQLGCSERTLRRLVAQALAELGVRSRFAAGARAAQLGLLD